MNIVLTGYGGSGKDTICKLLEGQYTSAGSSKLVTLFMRDYLADSGITYSAAQACYADRRNHRGLWATGIQEYNSPDLTRLGTSIFKDATIYNGLRSLSEYLALKEAGLIDCLIWVDAGGRVPVESQESMTLTKEYADYVIDNSGVMKDLYANTTQVFSNLTA